MLFLSSTKRTRPDPNMILSRAERDLRRMVKRYFEFIEARVRHADSAEPASRTMEVLTRIRYRLGRLRQQQLVDHQMIAAALLEMYDELGAVALGLGTKQTAGARAALTQAQHLLSGALEAIGEEKEPALPLGAISAVEIPTELISQAVHSLLPPERMAVIAGRQEGEALRLTAIFDVTGAGPDTHGFHVQADAGALARALIATELSGASFHAWIHSHPGRGSMATHPSGTDWAQYRALTSVYSPDLIGIIVVADGFVRFWGESNNTNLPKLKLLGDGIEKVRGEDHVYRIQR